MTTPEIPEAMWGGLARDMIMWLDMGDKTPRALFRHLKMCGKPVPDWLRDEPEMKNLDHVVSKGTRAVLIYKAMREAAKQLPPSPRDTCHCIDCGGSEPSHSSSCAYMSDTFGEPRQQVTDSDAAVQIAEEAFKAGFEAGLARAVYLATADSQKSGTVPPDWRGAWSDFESSEAAKDLVA